MLSRKPPRPGSEGEPPFQEPALVPRRPRPIPSPGTAVLEPPSEPEDVDARAREPD